MAMALERRTIWIVSTGFVLLVGGTALAMSLANRGPSADSIAAGKALFEHEFAVNDPICGDGDGLGPVFNEKSCVACHFLSGVGGAGPNENNVTAFEAFPVPNRPYVVAGGVHTFAIHKRFQESVEQLELMFPSVRTSVEMSGCAPTVSTFDPLQIDEINTPALFGVGLIDKISPAAIVVHGAKRSLGKVSRELGGDFAGTGVGRTRATGTGQFYIGKFGWKGQFETLEEFVATACAMELGLTNPNVAQPVALRYVHDENAKLDMTHQQLEQLVDFIRSLPAPEQVLPNEPSELEAVLLGDALFTEVGCADCHVRDIGGVEGIYSDFHLYNVEKDTPRGGVGGGYIDPDFSPAFTLDRDHPRPDEWKTPPLWGVADSAPYFHDGKSPSLLSAIKRHGHDGRASRQKFEGLSNSERLAVLSFLKTLRAPQSAPIAAMQ